MKLGLEQLLVRQPGLIFRDQCQGRGTAQSVFNNLMILSGAQQNSDGGIFVGILNVPIERLRIKLQLAEIFGLELVDFQLNIRRSFDLGYLP
jgi:hypothetical protein